jgi:hypothetical protein
MTTTFSAQPSGLPAQNWLPYSPINWSCPSLKILFKGNLCTFRVASTELVVFALQLGLSITENCISRQSFYLQGCQHRTGCLCPSNWSCLSLKILFEGNLFTFRVVSTELVVFVRAIGLAPSLKILFKKRSHYLQGCQHRTGCHYPCNWPCSIIENFV